MAQRPKIGCWRFSQWTRFVNVKIPLSTISNWFWLILIDFVRCLPSLIPHFYSTPRVLFSPHKQLQGRRERWCPRKMRSPFENFGFEQHLKNQCHSGLRAAKNRHWKCQHILSLFMHNHSSLWVADELMTCWLCNRTTTHSLHQTAHVNTKTKSNHDHPENASGRMFEACQHCRISRWSRRRR